MRLLLQFLFLCLSASVFSQFHDQNIKGIKTVQQAVDYAKRYREVSVGIVDAERDVFLFDSVDTTQLEAYIGETKTVYRRRTKFIKDTSVYLASLHTIVFDELKISADSAHVLATQIEKMYDRGVSTWGLMKSFENESCRFESGPVTQEELEQRYHLISNDLKNGDLLKQPSKDHPDYPVILIFREVVHKVPAFFVIAYNVAE